jgi:VCBS repeat-containing protein
LANAFDGFREIQRSDRTFFRVTGSTHGTAQLSGDGSSVIFTPEAGYSGMASFKLIADDGYSQSAEVTVTVNISSAKLIRLHLPRLAELAVGQTHTLQLTGDFEDEQGVLLPNSYLTFSSSDPTVATVNALGTVKASTEGWSLIGAQSHGIRAVNAVNTFRFGIDEEGSPYSPDYSHLDLGLYPATLTLTANGGLRQLKVTDVDGNDLTQAATGTRYFVSNAEVAEITADGLVRAKASGVARLSIVNAGGQTDIELKVQMPSQGATTINARDGGAVQGADGSLVLVGPGALAANAQVSINRIALTNVGMPLPAPTMLDALGAFQLDLGAEGLNFPAQLALKVSAPIDPATGLPRVIAAGTEVFFLRKGSIVDAAGVSHDTWWLIDNGVIGTDGIARTASPPYPGVSSSGTIIVATRSTYDAQTGSVQVNNLTFGWDSIWSPSTNLAMSAGLPMLGGGGAMLSVMASVGPLSVMRYTLDGSFQRSVGVTPQTPGPTFKLDFPAPPTLSVSEPFITHVDYLAGNHQLTLDVINLGGAIGNPMAKIWVELKPRAEDLFEEPSATIERGLTWQRFEVRPNAQGKITLTLPAGIAIQQHAISVRVTGENIDAQGSVSESDEARESQSVYIFKQQQLGIVTDAKNIHVILRGEQDTVPNPKAPINVIRSIDKAEPAANSVPLALYGSKTDAIVFADGYRTAYVAGRDGKVYALDTVSQEIFHTIQLPFGNANITSLAVAGDWLYVAEGTRLAGTAGRLLRVNIDPSSEDYLNVFQQISAPDAPLGITDLAVSANRYLAFTAPAQMLRYGLYGRQSAKGAVYVIDTQYIDDKGKMPDSAIRTVDLAKYTGTNASVGKGPQFIAPTGRAGEFLLTNALDHNNGLMAIRFVPNDKTGDLAAQHETIDTLKLTPSATDLDWLKAKHQENIQRAHGVVYINVDGQDYAIVADFNLIYNDPNVQNGTAAGKQIGGKLGIVKDPFGTPIYLGATTPIVGGSIDKLALSGDGSTLYADLFIEEPGAPGSGVFSTMKRSLLVWDAQALVRAAAVQGRALTTPIDQTQSGRNFTPIPALQPNRFDGPNANTGFQWIYGVALNNTLATLDAGEVRYGDIGKVDLQKLIKDNHPALSQSTMTGFQIDAAVGVQIVKQQMPFGEAPIYSVDKTNAQVEFANSGRFFVAPEITDANLQALREGKRLANRDAVVTVKVLIDGRETEFRVNITLTDFAEILDSQGIPAPSPFFGDRRLANPGYSAFELKGSVGVNQDNNALDVWRVEQRLRYLGFPALGAADSVNLTAPSMANNRIQNFDVDGYFSVRENLALQLFEKVVRYGPGEARRFLTFTAGADGVIEAGNSGQGQLTEDWLNAYNAPHWMEIFGTASGTGRASNPQLPGWTSSQTGAANSGQVERYGTSWLRDLMVAGQYAPAALQVNGIDMRFNGATDANHGFTPTEHVTHDLGMGFDLGLSQYVIRDPNQIDGSQPFPNIQLTQNEVIPGSGWSVDRAVAWSARLPDDLRPGNRPLNGQQQALRDFLALYSVTRADGGGVWSQLPVRNEVARAALFGTGNLAGALISNVVVGGNGANQNTYANIRYILQQQLQIPNTSLNTTYPGAGAGHHNHFHVFLRPPERVDLPRNLAADDVATATSQAMAQANLQAAALALFNDIQPEFDFEEGEVTMFVMDMPDAPPQQAQVMLVQVAKQQQTKAKFNRIIGVCQVVENHDPAHPQGLAMNGLAPVGSLKNYFRMLEKKPIGGPSIVTVLEMPKHGKLVDEGTVVIRHGSPFDTGERGYTYLPNPGIVDIKDRAVLQVEIAGMKVKMVYTFHVVESVDDETHEDFCGPLTYKRLSAAPEAGPLALEASPQSWSFDYSAIPNIDVNIADLPATSVGQTVAHTPSTGLRTSITLDLDAAGHGWFIDSTPFDNSEFLPTSNPGEWIAKPGSAAEGKMDTLSVLLHEYGHVLGLDHSADAHALMGEALKPGVRHLPSASDYEALWSAMGADGASPFVNTSSDPAAPGTPLPPGAPLGLSLFFGFGRLRPRGEAGLTQSPIPNPQSSAGAAEDTLSSVFRPQSSVRMDAQNAHALHLGLYNGNFDLTDPANSQFGWESRGQVSLLGSQAELSEDPRLMSGLTQTFIKPEGVVGLRFTLTGANFAQDSAAPPDAFEVALLDALTDQPVTGLTPLTGSDALFNLQSDGRAYAASNVSIRRAPVAPGSLLSLDTPVTVTVDLTSVATGSTLKLYFDLLGMGAAGSKVRIDDVRLLNNFNTEPVAVNDTVTTAEDIPVDINVRANDQDAEGDVLSLTLMAGPQHGTLTQNANGSLRYTPALNYYGTDSFTYKLNDGELDSNVATVTLTITPVNDAPVAGNDSASTLEDTAVHIAVRANDIDVDSASLTTILVTGPLHGSVSPASGGGFTYTPAANYHGSDSFTYKLNDGELNSNLATVSLTITPVNDAPVASNVSLTTNEDTALTIDLRAYASDVDMPPLPPGEGGGEGGLSASIVTGPARGVLTLNTNGTYTYTPNANFNGTDSFTYKVSDGPSTGSGQALDSNVATVTIAVASVNDAPRGASKTVSTLEDTPYVFTVADFGFSDTSDTPANNFSAVGITTLPTIGSLTLSGVAVAAGQSISVADIAAGLLRFAPIANANGNAYASLGFRVQDDGGVNNAGVDRDLVERTVTVNVVAVNDAPRGTSTTVSTLEDTPYVFTVADFGFSDTSDTPANNFSAVSITTLPTIGSLTLSSVALTAGQSVSVTEIAAGLLRFAPIANANGNAYASLGFRVQDDGGVNNSGADRDPTERTVTINVVSVNDAPRGTSTTITTLEDTPYVFTVADFGFSDTSDTPANNFSAVGITTLPTIGSLTLSGVALTAGQSVSVTEIAAGLLRFAPIANANGNAYANLGFRVQDDGSTANGGIDRDPFERTVAINVVSVNDAPRGTSTTVATLEDTPYVFTVADFGFSDTSDTPANNFSAVGITTLPAAGSLTLSGVAVAAGQSISVAEIAAGLLRFAPVANANGNGYASLNFRVQDDGGIINGGVDRDPFERTVTINVLAVNDAPVANNDSASTLEDTAIHIAVRANDIDIDSATLTTILVSGPLNGTVSLTPEGGFTYTPNLNYFGTDSFTYKLNDGALDSNLATVSLTITPVNDAPVAVSSSLTGQEDTPYVFTWADFGVSDVDALSSVISPQSSILITSLPLDGLLQYHNGIDWTAVAVGQSITRADIEAGKLCFGPDAHESGANGEPAGLGNRKADYARFTYQASDGELLSAQASLTIDIAPVADTPLLTLATPPQQNTGAAAVRLQTSWESAPNRNRNFTILPQSELEGWNVVREAGDSGQQAFIIWSTGDTMKDVNNTNRVVQAANVNGQNFLEMGNAMGQGHQTFGIERSVVTRPGVTYHFAFDYAGRLGYGIDFTRVGLYVDGVQVGSYANTSPNTALNWQQVAFQFTGNGALQTIRLITEGGASAANGRGAMIDDITVSEVLPLNTGFEGSPIRLSAIVSSLADTDGSETLAITVAAIPVGATLTDGTNSFTATTTNSTATVTTWNRDNLSITPPAGYTGTFSLTITASATETLTNQSASQSLALAVTVLPASVQSPIVLDLDGDGIHTVSLKNSRGTFDLLNSAEAIRSGWIEAGDGFLALDANGNGIIDNRSELFGGDFGEGFALLGSLDTNLDGQVNQSDARFAELRIWQDRNANHRTDEGELASLATHGIVSLSTRYAIVPEEQNGNWLIERAHATRADGSRIDMADVYLATEDRGQKTEDRQSGLLRREEEEQSASLTFRSEARPPLLDPRAVLLDPRSPILAPRSSVVIDWNGARANRLDETDEGQAKKKGKHDQDSGNWLTDFLAFNTDKKTLAEKTGLKVVLKERR